MPTKPTGVAEPAANVLVVGYVSAAFSGKEGGPAGALVVRRHQRDCRGARAGCHSDDCFDLLLWQQRQYRREDSFAGEVQSLVSFLPNLTIGLMSA